MQDELGLGNMAKKYNCQNFFHVDQYCYLSQQEYLDNDLSPRVYSFSFIIYLINIKQ